MSQISPVPTDLGRGAAAVTADEPGSDHLHIHNLSPDDRDYCVGLYTPAFEARTPFLMEYRVRRAAGACRWLLATGVPRYGTDGSFEGYIGCDVDITERKEAEARILESTPRS